MSFVADYNVGGILWGNDRAERYQDTLRQTPLGWMKDINIAVSA